MKSDFISLSFFCFSKALTVRKNAVIIITEKIIAPMMNQVSDRQISFSAWGTAMINTSLGEIPSERLPPGESSCITCSLLFAESAYNL